MNVENLKGLMDEFDPASLLPELDSILEGRAPLCTIADAAKSMELAELLIRKRING